MTLASARRIVSRVILGVAKNLLSIALVTMPAIAQDSVAHARCRDPHPAPACGSYFLFEYMGAVRLAGTQVTTAYETRDALRTWFAWDVGWMRNAGRERSRGASLSVGGSADGTRLAVKARGRWWLDHNLVVDAAAGPMVTALQNGGIEGQSPTGGATVDIGFGRARLGLVTLSTDMASQRGRMQFATHAGVRTESRGVVIVTVSAILGVVALIAAIGASCDGGCTD